MSSVKSPGPVAAKPPIRQALAAKRPVGKRPTAQRAPAKPAVAPAAAKPVAAPPVQAAKPAKSSKASKLPKAPQSPQSTQSPQAAQTAKAAKATKAAKAPKRASAAKVAKPMKLRQKPVRDSFTMPEGDFALIATLKARLLAAKRETKKSELLRAGLHALAALDSANLLAALNDLAPVKVGRPKSAD